MDIIDILRQALTAERKYGYWIWKAWGEYLGTKSTLSDNFRRKRFKTQFGQVKQLTDKKELTYVS